MMWLKRVIASLWFRLAVSLLLVAVVALKVNWGVVEARISGGNFAYLLYAIAIVAAALAIGAYRWDRLLRASEIRLSPGQLGRVYSVATFSGTFLPTTAGADLVRTILVSRRGEMLGRTAVSVVIDRAAAYAGLIGLAWIGLLIEPASVSGSTVTFLAVVTAASVAIAAVGAAVAVAGDARIKRMLPSRIEGLVSAGRVQIRGYLAQPRLLATLLVSSLAFQALVALQLVLLARAINVHLPFATAAVAVSLVTVVTLLPISVGGFGVREGTYVAVLGTASVGAAEATLVSLLTVVTLFIASLPGAYLLARRGLTPVFSVPVSE